MSKKIIVFKDNTQLHCNVLLDTITVLIVRSSGHYLIINKEEIQKDNNADE